MDKIKMVKADSKSQNGTGEKRKKSASDITTGMVKLIIICWLVPFLMISVVLFYFSNKNTKERINETITTSMYNSVNAFHEQLDNVIKQSKQATYDGVINRLYENYLDEREGILSYYSGAENLKINVTDYLNEKYMYLKIIDSTYIFFLNQDITECYSISKVSGNTYSSSVNNMYNYDVETKVRKVADTLGTKTKILVLGTQIYVVRNLVDKNFVPYAIIMMDVNEELLMSNVRNIVWNKENAVLIDDVCLDDGAKKEDININTINSENTSYREEVKVEYDDKNLEGKVYFDLEGSKCMVVTKFENSQIRNDTEIVVYLYILIILLMVPLMMATVSYYNKNVSYPIAKLLYASEKIEKGKYGYKIEQFNENREFEKLINVFNEMSESLKASFERIYVEEIAVRDANMQALQAQINPHFLNNTLEIINWKARIAGNDDVSGMIESLGVMMEATMNRKGDSFISIKEEMTYVDAYLYIIEQRFGELFTFEKEVDESLYNITIPRLIIQPLVENMVEHGADENGRRTGKLKIYADNKNLYIEVENKGHMSEQDQKRVEELLSDIDYTSKRKNIGIRNVNMRVKMLYGRNGGLTIKNDKNGTTVSKIVIEIDKLMKVETKKRKESAK